MADVALFGAGRMGLTHAVNIAESAHGRLRYVVDPNEETAARVAARTGALVAEADRALADPDISAVVIATPTSTHAELIERAAASAKAILCEKPVDLSLDRADGAIAAAAKASVPLCVGFQRRFDPDLRALHRQVRQNRIGIVQTLRITSRDPAPPPPGYLRQSGGLFRDMMIHDLDTACWLMGARPVTVHAMGAAIADPWIADFDDVDTAVVALRFADGRICTVENTRRCVYGFEQRVELFGAEGSLTVGAAPLVRTERRTAGVLTLSASPPDARSRYAVAYREEIHHFLEVADGRATPEVDGSAGRLALALADAAERSWRTGRPVDPT
ncbi:Gfo/Idh/MocA family oxidoreductase [Streptomyces canus]|uniref:Gfo/Idh/MocA family protein n=1 Tax=Streptomyces canus TaxID=58343 RepID=UPI003723B121